MKKKIFLVILLIIVVLSVGLVFKKRKMFDKMDNDNQDSSDTITNNLSKTCLVLKMSNKSQVECQDNVIYEVEIDSKFKVGDIIKIEYQNEFLQDNFLKVDKLNTKNYNYLNEENGLFKDYYSKALETLNKMSLDEKIGQILLARTSDINQIKDLKTYKFGGYLLFKRDFQDKSKDEVIKMIKSYQENSTIPLLIAADEEGGIVSRISSNKNLVSEPFKSPRQLYKEGGLSAIREDTINKNKILSGLGINLNLAPVVDVSTNETDYMYKRSLGEDASVTSEFAKVIIEASRENSVSYCLKHFPGYGNNSDTHVGLSYDTRILESIKSIDLLPFKSGIESGAESVLVSHNIVSSIDSDNPSSISSNVHNLLRGDLGFTGVIITDDLSMGAIEDYYKDRAVVNAINAGNDLLIVTDYKNSVKEIKEALANEELSENILNKRVMRILAWKYYKELMKG